MVVHVFSRESLKIIFLNLKESSVEIIPPMYSNFGEEENPN